MNRLTLTRFVPNRFCPQPFLSPPVFCPQPFLPQPFLSPPVFCPHTPTACGPQPQLDISACRKLWLSKSHLYDFDFDPVCAACALVRYG